MREAVATRLDGSGAEAPAADATRAGAPVRPCLWAVGGGKGGVGKSVVTSSLALALARRGQRCVLVDADLGGANLHTLLGLATPRHTLSHFLTGEVRELADVLSPTRSSNLWLASGARALLGMANPKHSKKEKLLRHVRALDVDHVFLDLSAGTAFNVLDFFLAARHGILVVVPEPTSIENAYHFLKAAFFRSLRNAARESAVRAAVNRVLEERGRRCVRSPHDLVAGVMAVDPEAGEILREQAKRFTPLLLVNQARTQAHRSLGDEMRLVCGRHLGTRMQDLGALERDECVRHAVRQQRPVLELFPGCRFAQDIEAVAERLLRLADSDLSAEDPTEEISAPAFLGCGDRALARYGLPGDERPGLRREPREPLAEPRATPPALPAVPPESEPDLPPFDLEAPGVYLQQCRERLGLALSELSSRTRIRGLESIEREHFDELPPEPYVRGQILQYARALGIADAESVAATFLARYRRALARP